MNLLTDCNDPGEQLVALNEHIITKEEFNSYINAYFNLDPFNPIAVIPKTFTAAYVESKITAPEVTCSFCVELEGNDDLDNTDIAINVFEPELGNSTDSYWPMVLFKGFFANLQDSPIPGAPVTFNCSKARKAGKEGLVVDCIVFEIISVGGTTYWDLSSTVPPKSNL